MMSAITFRQKKGLRQGDSMSPMLFNIVADMLAILIEHGKQDDQIAGVVPHLVDGGLSILQYADDTILFMEHDLDKARNLKLLLSAFEQMLVRESWTKGSSGVRPVIHGLDRWAVKIRRPKTIPVSGLDSTWCGRQAWRPTMKIPSYVTDSM